MSFGGLTAAANPRGVKPDTRVLMLRRFCLPSILTAFLDKHLPKRLWIMDRHRDREATKGLWGGASIGQGVSRRHIFTPVNEAGRKEGGHQSILEFCIVCPFSAEDGGLEHLCVQRLAGVTKETWCNLGHTAVITQTEACPSLYCTPEEMVLVFPKGRCEHRAPAWPRHPACERVPRPILEQGKTCVKEPFLCMGLCSEGHQRLLQMSDSTMYRKG